MDATEAVLTVSDVSEATARFEAGLQTRLAQLDPPHDTALRLFNGYTEGLPGFAVEVYGTTLVIHDAFGPEGNRQLALAVTEVARARLPWLQAVLLKLRESKMEDLRRGVLLHGAPSDLTRRIRENGVWYALRLTLNQDTSFYLDTRLLRAWATANLAGKRVLNAFAYTGSLGVAARAAPAAEVVHTDLKRPFLNVAKDSYAINGWPMSRGDFITGDFFDIVGRLKREHRLFDCVFLDPPIFSVTEQGRVDWEADMLRLFNKVRPLVAHQGCLVAVNNGVFVSGADFEAALNKVCADGYATLETRVDVPADFTGTGAATLPADPAPYNHSTKMALLRIRRKDERTVA